MHPFKLIRCHGHIQTSPLTILVIEIEFKVGELVGVQISTKKYHFLVVISSF